MNEEMNNNYNNAPNYNYEKKNNGVKVLLIILIVLVLCLIGLTCYKMFIYDKEDNGKTNYKKINYEIRKDEYDGDVLYIDNEYIPISESPIDQLTVKNFNDILVLEAKINIGNYIYAIGSDKKLIKFDYNGAEKNELEKIYNYELMKIDGKTLYIKGNVTLTQDYHNCDFYKENLDKVAYYTISYEYLGNGKFSEGKIVDKKTVAEVYANELNECENNQNSYEKINYEIKDYKHEKDGIEYDEALYVNGKLVEDGFIIKVEQFKDVLIVEETGVISGSVVYVTKEAEIKKFDYTNHPYGNTLHSPLLTSTYLSLGVYRSYQIVNDEVEFTVSRIGAVTSDDNKWLCDSKDEIGEYTIRYKYMGNGNFDVGKIIKEKTVKEIYPNACTSSISS